MYFDYVTVAVSKYTLRGRCRAGGPDSLGLREGNKGAVAQDVKACNGRKWFERRNS